MGFTHLHVHDEYSTLDGFGTAKSYVLKAKSIGLTSLALTNHGNIDGLIKFQKCCIDNEIKPILGCELYIVDDLSTKDPEEKRGHILVLVKNEKGWNNLTKMLTIANTLGFYKKPRVDYKTFLAHKEGLIILTACAASFINHEKGIEFLKKLVSTNKEDVYCEIMPIDFKDQKNHNKKIIKLAEDLSLKIVATNDCHYPNEKDAEYQDVLLAMQSKAKMSDKNRWKFEAIGLYLKSRKEMEDSFRKNHTYISEKIVKESLDNTKEIANKCNFLLKKSKVFMPHVNKDENQFDHFKKLCNDGLYDKIIKKGINSTEYRKRLNYEIQIIQKQGFVQYFLIIQDIVKWCKNNDILVGPGRGSVCGSLAAFLLDITDTDPIKHKLMFERFISPDRVDLPDIDIDFPDKKRGEVRKYIENKYGEHNVAGVSTFLKMRSKMVFRDVCRVYDIPLKLVNFISKFLDTRYEVNYSSDQMENATISNFKKIFKTVPECIDFEKKYPKIVEVCDALENQVRGIGKHAAAIIITKEDLRHSDRCNLTNRENVLTINWDKEDAEYMGMLKIDVLGLSNLSIMHSFKKLVKQNKDVDIDFVNDVDLTDEDVLKEFSKGNCVGVFQFGTRGMINLCRELEIDSFELLTHTTAIHRPASSKSGIIDKFKQRRFGKESSLYNNKLDEILIDTYGIIIYQEQIMRIVNELSGLSFTDADKIRKLLDWENKEELEKFKHPFIMGCVKNNIRRIDAINIWEELMNHASYGFNKSHACAYTILSFWNQWAKTYFPTEFFCASLTFAPQEKKEELLREAINVGLSVFTPKIGLSDPVNWISKDNNIFMPFIEIKGIGEKYAEKISKLKTKNGFFQDESEAKGKLLSILNEVGAYDLEKNIVKSNLIPYNFQ